MVIIKIFLIEADIMDIRHDFAFTLKEAVKYNEWYYGKDSNYKYYLANDINNLPLINPILYTSFDDLIPVGSIEFVLGFLKLYHKKTAKPINIPKELMNYNFLKRNVKYQKVDTETTNNSNETIFVKDIDKVKGYTNIIKPYETYPKGNYLISNYIHLDSEWRAFVYNNELVGLNNYSGSFSLLPDMNTIDEMINKYSPSAPKAYTLDVGVSTNQISDNDTFLIEVHNFYSCGLYGFSNFNLLPKMFVAGWNELIKNN